MSDYFNKVIEKFHILSPCVYVDKPSVSLDEFLFVKHVSSSDSEDERRLIEILSELEEETSNDTGYGNKAEEKIPDKRQIPKLSGINSSSHKQ